MRMEMCRLIKLAFILLIGGHMIFLSIVGANYYVSLWTRVIPVVSPSLQSLEYSWYHAVVRMKQLLRL